MFEATMSLATSGSAKLTATVASISRSGSPLRDLQLSCNWPLGRFLHGATLRATFQFPIIISRGAWLILDCARRTSPFLSCASREQGTARLPFPSFLSRALREHRRSSVSILLIVGVP